jgi:hydrogenase maturation protein HypF
LAIQIRGIVQGVGFRPFVFNAAQKFGLTGWVRNEADLVRIEVQGPGDRVEAFCRAVQRDHPPQARIDSFEVSPLDFDPRGTEPFQVRPSSNRGAPGPAIPADLATCAECNQEIRTPGERRRGYAFTNCTACGPRWSIIRQLPYDRPRTSMAPFGMCPDCQREYHDPADRRFHAQPIACPACGPGLQLLDRAGRQVASGDEALKRAAEAVASGSILALKGLGGFQLLADALDAEAVALLRRRKHRPHKPLAVMFPSLDVARRWCRISPEEARSLSSHEAPILLVRRRDDAHATGKTATGIAAGVAPDNPYLGVMLPYTPLHHLLVEAIDRPIVCTSGNLSEEPMAIDVQDALVRLGPIADLFLTHDRAIVRPVDDSVGRIGPHGLQLLRRARGFAPLPIELGFDGPPILAVGGHLKNTVALRLGSQVVVTPHVGDLDSVASVEVHRGVIRDLLQFFDVVPEIVVCDLHPDYASTRHAERLAQEWDVPLVRVAHHHAHVAACAAEHQLDGPVLGFSFDGTGHGTDGTAWGGEMLLCEGARFDRVAHLRRFAIPGSDRAAREPRRSALGVLFAILGKEALPLAEAWFAPTELETLATLLTRSIHAPPTSSLGRLFDAVACLCGLPPAVSFEGQAAMALEFAADRDVSDAYPLALGEEKPAVADWEPMIRAVLDDRKAGRPIATISARFHNALAELAVTVARRQDCRQVALSGGCFQNELLSQRVRTRLLQAGFSVYTHRMVPPGDGGLALGQVAIAAAQVKGR